MPQSGVSPDRTVCSCDDGQYYPTLTSTGSICAYTTSDPYVVVPPNAGPWSFITEDLEPSTCTATVFAVSTTNIMPTGAFVVEVSCSKSKLENGTADTSSRPTGKVAVSGSSPQTRVWICRVLGTMSTPRLHSHAMRTEVIHWLSRLVEVKCF